MNTRSGPALAALFAAAFVMGSAELLVVGVIDLIAADLHVSVSTAGAAVTARAIGIVLGGISVSTAIGVPLGTLVGQWSGWRTGFVGVAVLGLAALLALLR